MSDCIFEHDGCEGKASSKEHVIHNSRRRFIRDNGGDLGNEKARFKGITCNSCNNFLGQKEELYNSSLAISTLWKVIAGNINNVFASHPWCLTNNTSKDTLIKHAANLKAMFLNNQIAPENMLSYRLSYSGTTNSLGQVKFSMLRISEGVIVVPETLVCKGERSGNIEKQIIDILVYHTHTANAFRMLFFLPLLPADSFWPHGKEKVTMSHGGFGKIASNLFDKEGVKITLEQLYPHYRH